jgi:hypothetical protein
VTVAAEHGRAAAEGAEGRRVVSLLFKHKPGENRGETVGHEVGDAAAGEGMHEATGLVAALASDP